MGPAIAGQQAGPRADVGAGQLEVAAPLAGPLALPAAVDVAAVAMPLDPRFRDIGDEMVVEGVGGYEVGRATMGALRGMDLVLDERGIRGWFGAEDPGVLAMLPAAAVGGRTGLRGPLRLGALAPLVDLLQLVLHLGQAPLQLSVLRLEVGVLRLELGVLRLQVQEPLRKVHDARNVSGKPESGKCTT
jgi:hypothetical protein